MVSALGHFGRESFRPNCNRDRIGKGQGWVVLCVDED